MTDPKPATERAQADTLLAEMRRAAVDVDAAEWATQLRRALERLGSLAHEFVKVAPLPDTEREPARCTKRCASLPSEERVTELMEKWREEAIQAKTLRGMTYAQKTAVRYTLEACADELSAALAGKG